ncbi:uncharacterized protein TNCV_2731351 [Trichonephila clavipes]|nr:uncharacterized protein TNCV_2731351 [Trichonephila clavipes]
MGTRLRRLKAQLKGQILSDASRRNHCSVQNMRQAIWVIFLHNISTEEYPQHGFCPIGEDSWCGFKKAESSDRPPNRDICSCTSASNGHVYYDGHSSSWPSWIVVLLSLSLKFEDYLTLGIPLR